MLRPRAFDGIAAAQGAVRARDGGGDARAHHAPDSVGARNEARRVRAFARAERPARFSPVEAYNPPADEAGAAPDGAVDKVFAQVAPGENGKGALRRPNRLVGPGTGTAQRGRETYRAGVLPGKAEFLERAGAEHPAAGLFPRGAVVEEQHPHARGGAPGGENGAGRARADDGDVDVLHSGQYKSQDQDNNYPTIE